jgi:hypothetical protein
MSAFSRPNARAGAVLVDELDANGLYGALEHKS